MTGRHVPAARIPAFWAAFLLLATPIVQADPAPRPPEPAREFRGAWIASVSNIDWPSEPGLPEPRQKAELLALLDRARQLRLNAVILQVRPACDALYRSPLEPWSEYLTGRQGVAPSPGYDPLTFAVAAAHERGLELHAWFNPFRARHPSAKSPDTPEHVSRRHPEWVRKYGSYLWMDPSEEGARRHSLLVIRDVLTRYDIDGIHLDDYFYPYQVKDARGAFVDFPDQSNWNAYRRTGGTLSREDWRRSHVDHFVEDLYRQCKRIKPTVKVGISPFGIWRPGYPSTIQGLDAYDHLYADARKWMIQGWVDYLAPQLYWRIEPPAQSYPVLLKWWAEQNPLRRHLWPGLNTANTRAKWPGQEIVDQVQWTRRLPASSGNIHWNMSSLMPANPNGPADQLSQSLYSQPALVPASTWLPGTPPPPPRLNLDRSSTNRYQAHWQSADPSPPRWWVLQVRIQGRWFTEILPGHRQGRPLYGPATPHPAEAVAIRAVDAAGNASPPTLVVP